MIYLDNAATSPVSESVIDAMMPYFTEQFGNPSSSHAAGAWPRKAIQIAEEQVKQALHADVFDNVYFTSGGTESDNWAIKGYTFANRDKGNHIITTQIEHPAVLNTCKFLERVGFNVTYLPVDSIGRINISDLKSAITDQTILISVMTANNEIGTIEPIADIGEIARSHNIAFHTDAVQAIGDFVIDVQQLKVDMLSLSAHKFHGPKGVGALYVRNGIRLEPLIHGGGQQSGMRAGTENVPGIVGLGQAIQEANDNIAAKRSAASEMLKRMASKIFDTIDDAQLIGPIFTTNRLRNNLNYCFHDVDSETLLLNLDLRGIAASSGSACTASSIEPSHVLTAIGLTPEEAKSCIRFTIGDNTTEAEVDKVCEDLAYFVNILRDRRHE